MTESNTTNAEKKLLCINSLKGIGAFIIAFFWHYQHFSPSESPLYNIFEISYNHGYLMVELFFMLSGFGMVLGYKKKIQNREITFPTYLKRRFFKLYPPFLITLFATGLLECIHISQTKTTFVYGNFDLYHFLLNLLLMQNGFFTTDWSFDSPSWCISVCLFCYVAFYVLVYKSNDRQSLLYKFIVMFFIAEYFVSINGIRPIFNAQMARGLACFSLGVIISYVWSYRTQFNHELLGRILLLLLIGGYIAIRYNPEIIGNMSQLFTFGIGPMILMCSLFHKQLNKIIQSRVLVFLGSISLSIYLWHFPIQCAIKDIDLIFSLNINYSSISIWAIYVITTLIVASFDKCILSRYYRNALLSFINQFRSK